MNIALKDNSIVTSVIFFLVNDRMHVQCSPKDNAFIPNVYCIGDVNGKMMIADTTSVQEILKEENIIE